MIGYADGRRDYECPYMLGRVCGAELKPGQDRPAAIREAEKTMKPETRPIAQTVDLLFVINGTDQFLAAKIGPENHAVNLKATSLSHRLRATIRVTPAELPQLKKAVHQLERWAAEEEQA